MCRKFYLIILTILLQCSVHAQKVSKESAVEVYKNIITAIGNSTPVPPILEFKESTKNPASFNPFKKKITIEEKVLEICYFFGQDSLNALAYILSHELAHSYCRHGWHTQFAALDFSNQIDEDLESFEKRIDNETQADVYAGFFSHIAGYNALDVAGDFLNKPVAAELVTLIDYANTMDNNICPVPVFVDDEGTKAKDVKIIDNGILKKYMHNKDSANELSMNLTGNARAYRFSDEPLIRMRNTAIRPGDNKLADMISSIDSGYYLTKSSNGQADSTSEFMFGVVMGYEIKNGKIKQAIKDTTISGIAFDVLKTITMISDEMVWSSGGMCGKKQIIPVGMGGPAIKCKLNIGGR